MVGMRLISLDVLFRGLSIAGYKVSNRYYTVFPPYYVEPVYRNEEQEAFKDEKKGLVVPQHIKPTPPDVTSSEFFDIALRNMTNLIMRDGKKDLARNIMATALTSIKLKQLKHYHHAPPEQKADIELDPKVIFLEAIKNCKPVLTVTKIKRGGMVYEVPVNVTDKKATFMAMKWLIEVGKQKDRKIRFANTLAMDILDAFNNTGRAVKLKQALHKKCDENRAYAHYRWIGSNIIRR